MTNLHDRRTDSQPDLNSIRTKAIERARWILSLPAEYLPQGYEIFQDEDKLVEHIIRKELDRLESGKPSLFERKGLIPNAKSGNNQ